MPRAQKQQKAHGGGGGGLFRCCSSTGSAHQVHVPAGGSRSSGSGMDGGGQAAARQSIACSLREELSGLKLSALKRRAIAAGVESSAIEDVDDSDDPKEAMIV
eukprot:SAG22_NODE_10147_length_550_cov_1.097561_1_plen_102_part_01